jgi:hypothetical protein
LSYNNCTCLTGYTGTQCNIPICYSILATQSSVCSNGNGTCTNHDICTCNTNYSGNQCQYPICYNYSSIDARVCSGKGSCSSPNTCTCNTGYTGNNCQFSICYNKSANDSSVCSSNGICTQPDTCVCTSSYTGNQCQYPICNGKLSTDVGVCSGHGSCVAAICQCNFGYLGNDCQFTNITCFARNSTDVAVCSAHGVCLTVDKCTCDNGYVGPDCSIRLPLISSLSSSTLIGNQTFTISGNYFRNVNMTCRFSLNTTRAWSTAIFISSTQIICTVPLLVNNKLVALDITNEGTYYSTPIYFYYVDPSFISYLVPLDSLSLFTIDVPSGQGTPTLSTSANILSVTSSFPASVSSTIRNAAVISQPLSIMDQISAMDVMISTNTANIQHGNVIELWLIADKFQYLYTGLETSTSGTYMNVNYAVNESVPVTTRQTCAFQVNWPYSLKIRISGNVIYSDLIDVYNYNSPSVICSVQVSVNMTASFMTQSYRMGIAQSVFVNNPVEFRLANAQQNMQVLISRMTLQCQVQGCNIVNATTVPTNDFYQYGVIIGVVVGVIVGVLVLAVIAWIICGIFVCSKKTQIKPATIEDPNIVSEDELWSNLKNDNFYGF